MKTVEINKNLYFVKTSKRKDTSGKFPLFHKGFHWKPSDRIKLTNVSLTHYVS